MTKVATSFEFFAIALALAFCASQVLAYDPTCSDNLAVYWGQNSYGVTHRTDLANWQQTISTYCQDTTIDAIPIAFVDVYFSTGGLPQLDLSNICGTGSGVFPGTNLANCQFLAAGIEACQAQGTAETDGTGTAFANTIWDLFLGGSSSTRPFGNVVLDGVDLDIEIGDPTGYAAFVNQIRALSAGASKQYFVTAAPQCPFPDVHIGGALNAASFDADWDYSQWDTWAKTVSPNPNVRVFIGAPASPTAGAGYVDAATLGALAVSTREQFSSFGGIMLWDASQAFVNGRYDQQIKSLISNNCAGGGGTPPPPSSCAQTYTVVSGDTCASVESKTGISDATLRSLNPSINTGCTNLAVGQVLCVEAGSTYTVVINDTCSAIESKTGISDATLRSLNPSINAGCTNLAVGQFLCVEATTSTGTCTETYTVVSGDSCSSIESKEGVSDAQLHTLNPTINSACTNLSVGQTLCLAQSSCSQMYTVVSGDTCGAIESKFGISDATLRSLNPSINSGCTNLSVGQQLCV
ncbi:glycoside hydrolase superfamily [Roridomyces roridus]|uniref:Glycoside hydrolase superfamily n=1 Tax=Roridomyces roridus TaxID=1738132 RepID=A0AAD7BQG3_9AGAR|nr:glycoside hydrolase superfamily [Roridomyces roridus]